MVIRNFAHHSWSHYNIDRNVERGRSPQDDRRSIGTWFRVSFVVDISRFVITLTKFGLIWPTARQKWHLMVETIGALVVCVLNAGRPGAGLRVDRFPLGVRLPLPLLGLHLCLPLPLPLGANEGLPLPRPFPNPLPLPFDLPFPEPFPLGCGVLVKRCGVVGSSSVL
jgi:hypothetical protein